MNNDKEEKRDSEALALLEEATKQFEAYLRITAAAQSSLTPEKEGASRPDWTHPMGLVLASSR